MKAIQKIGILAILVLGIQSCGEKRTEGDSSGTSLLEETEKTLIISEAQFQNQNMQLGKPEMKPVTKLVQASGYIDVPPENRAVISAIQPGYVKTAPYIIGDQVRKGAGVITLENQDFIKLQQEFIEVSAKKAYLEAEYRRQKTLLEEKISSEKNFLKAESDYRENIGHYEGLKKQLKLLNINPDAIENGQIISAITLYAPIGGSVTKVNVSKGKYAAPSDELMEIVNKDHIHLELAVFEKDIMKIKIGQPISFHLADTPSEVFEGEVYKVGAFVEEESRTLRVHGHISDDEPHNFAIGMFVQAGIQVESTESWALPDSAILREGEESYVLQFREKIGSDYIFLKTEVEAGESYNGYVPISDLEENKDDQYLTKGAYWFLDQN